MKESTFWKILCVALAGFVVAVLGLTCLMELGREETEYDIIQAIIENIPAWRRSRWNVASSITIGTMRVRF